MQKKTTLPVKQGSRDKEIQELGKRIMQVKDPDQKDIGQFTQLVLRAPDIWPIVVKTSQLIRRHLIERMGDGLSRACMTAELDILKKQLGYDGAPPLEQILIDHILTTQLRLFCAEMRYNSKVAGQLTPGESMRNWDDLLTSAQNRHLKAIETYARVRKLSKDIPPVQINIAQHGGQQVNMQGEIVKK